MKLFPRTELLLKQLNRMDPGFQKAHAKPSLIVFFLLCLSPALDAAPAGGQAVKILRAFAFGIEAASPSPPSRPPEPLGEPTSASAAASGGTAFVEQQPSVSLFDVVAPTRGGDSPVVINAAQPVMPGFNAHATTAGYAANELIPVDFDAAYALDSRASVDSEAGAKNAGSGSAGPSRAAGKSHGFISMEAYLPISGALPLRFAESKGWPPPIDPHALAALKAPAKDIVAEIAAVEPEPLASEPVSASEPVYRAPVLTADMVLEYIGDLSTKLALDNDSFLPALSGRVGASRGAPVSR